MTYSLITSVKNEGQFIRATLESVINQEALPAEWIIIDDESDDDTRKIVQEYLNTYKWITLKRMSGFKPDIKATGGRVAYLLNEALGVLSIDTDLVVKLDGDVSFSKSFFRRLINAFDGEPSLGIVSGWLIQDGEIEVVKHPRNYIRGAVMVIRKEILVFTGGFFGSKTRGDDEVLAIAARSRGYTTCTLPVYFDHLKPQGRRHSRLHEHWVTGCYKGSLPYTFSFFLLTLIKNALRYPPLISVLIQLAGYLKTRFIERYLPFPNYISVQVRTEQNRKLKDLLKFNFKA